MAGRFSVDLCQWRRTADLFALSCCDAKQPPLLIRAHLSCQAAFQPSPSICARPWPHRRSPSSPVSGLLRTSDIITCCLHWSRRPVTMTVRLPPLYIMYFGSELLSLHSGLNMPGGLATPIG